MSEYQDELPYDMNDYYREMAEVDSNRFTLSHIKYLLKKINELEKRIDTQEWSGNLTELSRVNPKHEEA